MFVLKALKTAGIVLVTLVAVACGIALWMWLEIIFMAMMIGGGFDRQNPSLFMHAVGIVCFFGWPIFSLAVVYHFFMRNKGEDE